MIDPLSIASLIRVGDAFRKLQKRFSDDESKKVQKVIKFCDEIARKLNELISILKGEKSGNLNRLGSELKMWGTFGIRYLQDTLTDEEFKLLSASIVEVADSLMSSNTTEWTSETRESSIQELEKASGQFGGVADVLRFQYPVTPRRDWPIKNALVSLGTTAVVGAMATGVSKVPLVGPTLASWIKGDASQGPGDDSDFA